MWHARSRWDQFNDIIQFASKHDDILMRYDYLLSLAMQLVMPLLERRYNTIHL